jgi:hypothetical protein
MTRDQAEEIQRCLFEAAAAMSRAQEAIAGLDREDRRRFIMPLSVAGGELQDKILWPIYQRFPELQPPGEVPTISSELCWDDVILPSPVTERDLDEMIFALLTPRWHKTAMILVQAQKHIEKNAWPIEVEVVAARIQALADNKRIDHQGDLRMWRFSEVRLLP